MLASDPVAVWDGWSFLAPKDGVADWRLVVAWEAADACGLLAALPGTPAALARRLDLDPHAVRVLLEALAVWDMVEADPGGGYALAAEAPDEVAGAVLAHHARAIRRWSGGLEARVRAGDPTPRPGGLVRAARGRWYDALAVNARCLAPAVADVCLDRFPDARRVLDLGGGHGEYGLEFARRGLAVTMQDLPETIAWARDRGVLAAAGVELFAGDFFDVVAPGPFDVVVCGGVAYTYGRAENVALYRQVRSVLAAGGGFGIVGFVRDRSPVSALFALQMLLARDGADTHAEPDYRDWLTQVGFTAVDVTDLADRPQSLVLATG